MNSFIKISACILGFIASGTASSQVTKTSKPNIVIIYTDDVGYGDIGCYGANTIATPNIDNLAKHGVRFTNAHATSATCTPSRFSLLTGKYAWRKAGTGIAPGDAALLITTDRGTLAGMMQKAGYTTGVVGKWHLGLGPAGGPEWNADIKPGPLEIGFNYSYLIPATGDSVPCVFVENHGVVNLDKNDPITVSYKEPINPNDPTGKKNPELLKMHPSHGHDQTIVNGVSRIGYMTGGKAALWIDEQISNVLTDKAVDFIDKNKSHPFFLYFSTHDIDVPRMPNERFKGKSGMGPRGDAILELDWSVGEVIKALEKDKLLEKTIIIFTSDNGPVVDDGYKDEAVEKLGNHKPGGPFRGGKYSAFDAGTRIPMIVSWKGKMDEGKVSDALVSQIDFYASFAALNKQTIPQQDAVDSKDYLTTILNKSVKSRDWVIEQSLNSTLSIIKGDWKYIEPSKGPKINKDTNTELGNSAVPQLYNLKDDIGETRNLATDYPDKVKELSALLEQVKNSTGK